MAGMADPWRNRIVGSGEEAPDQLLANPANWRIHGKAQQAALSGALGELGWIQQIVVNQRTGHVIDGHLRVSLAISKREPMVPVLYVDLTPEEEALALLTLDPIAAMAAADKEQLDALLRDVQTGDAGLMAMLAELAAKEGLDYGKPEVAEDPGAQVDRAEELREKWGCKVGQVWELGRHRLAIGDCTDEETVSALMQGEKAGAVVTDPPYGIEREGILNDDPEGLQVLYQGCLAAMPMRHGIVLAFQSTRLFPVWLDAIRSAGHTFERMLWMYKPNDVTFPWRGWLLKSEAILASTIGSAKWLEVKPYAHDCYTSNWSNETKGDVDGWHASIKPLPVVEDLIARVDGMIYEPFCGSGTALVACERLGRDCRAVELHPPYAAVTIQRWAELTGREPVCVPGR